MGQPRLSVPHASLLGTVGNRHPVQRLDDALFPAEILYPFSLKLSACDSLSPEPEDHSLTIHRGRTHRAPSATPLSFGPLSLAIFHQPCSLCVTFRRPDNYKNGVQPANLPLDRSAQHRGGFGLGRQICRPCCVLVRTNRQLRQLRRDLLPDENKVVRKPFRMITVSCQPRCDQLRTSRRREVSKDAQLVVLPPL